MVWLYYSMARTKPDPTRPINITMPQSLVMRLDELVYERLDIAGEYESRSSLITKAVKQYLTALQEVKNVHA